MKTSLITLALVLATFSTSAFSQEHGSLHGAVYLNGSPATSETRVAVLTPSAYLKFQSCRRTGDFRSCFSFTSSEAWETDTDYNNGSYEFNYLTPGDYYVFAIHDGANYEPRYIVRQLTIGAGDSEDLDLRL